MTIYKVAVGLEVEGNNPDVVEDFVIEELAKTDIAYIEVLEIEEKIFD